LGKRDLRSPLRSIFLSARKLSKPYSTPLTVPSTGGAGGGISLDFSMIGVGGAGGGTVLRVLALNANVDAMIKETMVNVMVFISTLLKGLLSVSGIEFFTTARFSCKLLLVNYGMSKCNACASDYSVNTCLFCSFLVSP
jgi:hypothetical protein